MFQRVLSYRQWHLSGIIYLAIMFINFFFSVECFYQRGIVGLHSCSCPQKYIIFCIFILHKARILLKIMQHCLNYPFVCMKSSHITDIHAHLPEQMLPWNASIKFFILTAIHHIFPWNTNISCLVPSETAFLGSNLKEGVFDHKLSQSRILNSYRSLAVPRNGYGSDQGQQRSGNTVKSYANFKALGLDEIKAKYKKWKY